VGSAFPPDRMAECGLPYIPAIEGELVVDCTLCTTTPTPLFNPKIPIPHPPSFDFGCYPIIVPKFTVYKPHEMPVPPHYYLHVDIEYPYFLTTGYCQPQFHFKVKFPTTKSHFWDACVLEDWPFVDEFGTEINPFTGEPVTPEDKQLKYCCEDYGDEKCLEDIATGSKRGTIKQFANWGCDTLKIVIADRTAYASSDSVKPSEGEEDNHLETGYVEMQFPVCDVVFCFVCDVYCDVSDYSLKVGYRRAYFKRGILVQLDGYVIGSDFSEDETDVSCGVAAECPII